MHWSPVSCLGHIQEITKHYEKNDWKKHDKEPILFKFHDNKQPITAKLSAANGRGWEAELEGGDHGGVGMGEDYPRHI